MLMIIILLTAAFAFFYLVKYGINLIEKDKYLEEVITKLEKEIQELRNTDPTTYHPIQYVYLDDSNIVRFRRNAIVRLLLDDGPFDMNKLAMIDFTQADREQFAQLIGYSVSGFSELSYVSDETYYLADEARTKLLNKEEKNVTL